VTVFIYFAKGVVLLTVIVIVLSLWILLFNKRAISTEAIAKDNRLSLRHALVSYLKGTFDLVELQRVILGKENLLMGLVAQLAEESSEPERLKLIDLFVIGGLYSIVEKELKALSRAYNWRQRQRAATFLPYIAKREVIIPVLLSALEDRTFMVRFSAAHALAKVKAVETIIPILEHLSLPSEWPIERTIEIIYEMGKEEAITMLLQYISLPSAKGQSKIFAISALGLQKESEAIPSILTHLTNPDKELRIQSAKALGNIGDTQAVHALCGSMYDSMWEVRAASASSLGLLRDGRAISTLVKGLCDSEWWVRYNCANALAELGDDGIAALKEAHNHDDKFAREVSRLVLQEQGFMRMDQEEAS